MYFNSMSIIKISFVLPAAEVFPVNLILNFSDSEFVKTPFGLSL